MINIGRNQHVKQYIVTFVGAVLMAVAAKLVYDPLGMVTGGVTGLAIVVKQLTKPLIEGGLPLWIFNILCNVPLFIIAVHLKGMSFIKKTLFATVIYIFALSVIPSYNITNEDYLLASIFGGVVGGLGIGLVFSALSSTGGTDLLATLIHDRKKYYSVPQILTIIDCIIVVIGAVVFGVNIALYAIIAVYITAKVSDGILEGLKFAKMAYIISDKYSIIADEILNSLQRGVTSINAMGMYSNNDKRMLFCVVSKKEIVKIIEIAHRYDSKCFIIVSDVREVMGEGFIEYRQEK